MDRVYPQIKIQRNETANRFYAVPLIGILVKIIALIPVFIEFFFLGIGEIFVLLANSFYVLFTGKYWDNAYRYNLGLLRFSAKVYFYLQGLTDKYPGFDFNLTNFSLDIDSPKTPNRYFAIPFLGGLVRFILLIPYFIFIQVIQTGAEVGVFLSFAKVLFEGKYPESTYEFARDSQRVSLASSSYIMGLSDSYPSFNISMNHKNIKIALIIAGIILSVLRYTHTNTNRPYRYAPPQPASYTTQAPTQTY